MSLVVPRRRSSDLLLGLLGVALVGSSLVFAVLGPPPLPPAPMVWLGIASPLSGMTRSFVAIASGDIGGAFALHPLGPFCFAACLIAAMNLVAFVRSGERSRAVDRLVGLPYLPWIVAAAFGAAWIRQVVVFT